MIQVSKVKKIFNTNGVQVSAEAMNLIKEDINRQLNKMAKRCSDGNVKRLTISTYHIAIGNLNRYLK
jgi:hypothetical protein